MKRPDVLVRIDDRVRLMSAVLAATTWPDDEQKDDPHGTHAHARATRKLVKDYSHHPAVQAMQILLEQGAPLEAMFTYALRLSWPALEADDIPRWIPPRWNEHLAHFYQVTNLEQWWEDEADEWNKALEGAKKVFAQVSFHDFLEPFIGSVAERFIFLPNICYPTKRELGTRVGAELFCIAPPRLAWGDSPPWPFDEDPAHIYRAALSQYGRMLILAYLRQHSDKVSAVANRNLPVGEEFTKHYPSWNEQFAALFVMGAVALFLEKSVSKQEAKAYILMERKAKGVTILPGVVSVLRRYLEGYEEGRYSELIDYLPNFPKHLRVAKSITTL